jgi:hypothetical protein
MINKTYNTHSETISYITKVPLDVRIVSYLFYALGIFQLMAAILLISVFGRLGENAIRRVLFGTVLLDTELEWSIYLVLMGSMYIYCGREIIRIKKSGWLVAFFFILYEIIDMTLLLPRDRVNAYIGLGVSISIIMWLLYRMHLYNIGSSNLSP